MSASSCCCSLRGRPTLTSKATLVDRRRRSMPKAQTPNLSTASPASRQRQLAIPRALGGAGGSGGDPDDWLERIKQGIPEVEAPDYSSDSSPPPSTRAPRAPGTTPLGARPRRGAGGSASSFSSVSSYSSDDEARASVRRQERILLDAWTGVGDEANRGGNLPAPSLPVVGGASALLLLALLVAAGPPS